VRARMDNLQVCLPSPGLLFMLRPIGLALRAGHPLPGGEGLLSKKLCQKTKT
jgi:hypothetical protein